MLYVLVLATLFVSTCSHQFFAEHTFICNVCQDLIGHVSNGGKIVDYKGCIDDTGEPFTSVCDTLLNDEKFQRLVDGRDLALDELAICESLQYCSQWIPEIEFAKTQVWDEQLVDLINNDEDIPWTAELPIRFKGFTYADIQKELGTVIDPEHVFRLPEIEYPNMTAPTNFDTRTQWKECSPITGHVRDQSSCGSCWAFGSTEAFNDRVCIANLTNNNTPFLQLLSTENTNDCCSGSACGYSNGCNGGQPTAAWSWFKHAGSPSGGDYDDIGKTDTCEPYSMPPCAHHVTNSSYTPCPSTEYHTPRCKSACSNNYYKSWSADKHYAASAYSLRTVNSIEQDLVKYGSVSAAFTVYQDFVSYKSGVYVHKTGRALGGHAIKIFGYGEMDGKKYWYCTNSWNQSWGNNGFFKILKGVDECGIERDVSAGHPKL